MKKDKFTRSSQKAGYLVRSLYFDTHSLSAYHEKMSGDNERIKFRIRTYHDRFTENAPIRVELKGRKSGLVIKKSAFISTETYQQFLINKHWLENDPVLEEFERLMQIKSLEPKVITQYRREGYETRYKGDLRITFDHNVESTHANELFPNKAFYKEHHRNAIIMEIKFKKSPPKWVHQLVHIYGLKAIANSKFTQAIQVSRKDLHHPGGIIVVR